MPLKILCEPFFAKFFWGPEILSLFGFSFCGDTLVRVARGRSPFPRGHGVWRSRKKFK